MSKSRIRHLRHVLQLGRNITPTQVGRIVGGDYEAFILVTVAEAVFSSCPPGVEAWLRQPENLADWAEALVINASRHQIAWWTRKVRLGADAEETQEARRKLDALRGRLNTAVVEFRKLTDPKQHVSAEEARSMNRLRDAHREEYNRLVETYERKYGGYRRGATDLPESVARMCELGDDEFREVVMADLSGRADEDLLAHPALLPRWRNALREIGDKARASLGFPPVPLTFQHIEFRVADSALPENPDRETALKWIRAIKLLGLVEARTMECDEHSRKHRKDRGDTVFAPAEEKLREAHWAEYINYRVDEERRSSEKRAIEEAELERIKNFPEKLAQSQEQLSSLGWDAHFVRREDLAWLDIRRGRLERMMIAVRRKKKGGTKTRSHVWRYVGFSICKPDGSWYRLPDLESIMMLAALPEVLYGEAQNLLVREQRIVGPVRQGLVPPTD